MAPVMPWGSTAFRAAKVGADVEIALQRTDLEIAPEIGFDSLRRSDGPRKSGVIRHFMQEGSPAQRAAVGQRLRPLGGVEEQLDLAVADRIHDIGPSLGGFQDAVGGHPLLD